MAVSAIGGWMASAGVAKLVDQMCCFAGDQYGYQRDDAKEKLRRLKESLWKVKAVLHIANSCLQTKNPSMENWLGCIEDAVCHAEDVLDLFDYRDLEATVDEYMVNSCCCTADSSSPVTSTTIITPSTSTTSSLTVSRSARFCKRFFFSDEDLNELIATVDRLDKISSELQTLLMLVKPLEDSRFQHSTTQWRRTTSMPGITKFCGRIREEYELKNLIVRTHDESQPYSVIAVVGLAGVGKTALVQRVYSYFRDAGHFDFMAWIHVSENFDAERLTKEMVQAQECQNLKGSSHDRGRISWHGSVSADWNNMSLDQLQIKLQQNLHGKTMLLILDDIWNEKSSQLVNLCNPFQSSKGSKVVLTTRSHKVAKINGATKIIPLDGLKDEYYWEHFTQCAFGNAAPTDFPQLLNLGQQLANKLACSPLAAKTVGRILQLMLHEDHWRAVLGRKLWLIEQEEDDIIPALRLSYKQLPDKLKQCFVYFALFPKKYPLRGDVLIQMWRAQGYIEKETPDETAHRYIDDLLQLSFIQKAANQDEYYVVHDLLHDLADSISKGEHFRIEDDFNVSIPENVRHLYVNARNILKVFISLTERKMKKGLRSLIISSGDGIHPSNFNKALEEILHLHQLRSLRVLVLCHRDGILPDNIEHLVHLSYLDIRGSSMFTEVPKSLFKLYHLQGHTLQFRYKDKIRVGLQQGISRLTQLRHLTAPSKIISGIAHIGRLTLLQALEEYHVERQSGHTICQFKELNKLRGKLSIKNLENVRCNKESSEARLNEKLNLKKIPLCWNQLQQVNTSNTEYEGVFEGLKPNCNLRELYVTGYMGTTSPTWLTREYLQNIQKIELASCHHWKALPSFGSLPFLKILKMRHFKAVEQIDAGFYGDAAMVFPSLEEILFENMEQWKQWSGVEPYRGMFSRVCNIFIKNCRNFKGPLPLPVSPKGIDISVTDWLSTNVINTTSLKESNDLTKSFKLFLDHYGLLFGCLLPSNSLATIQVLDFSSRGLVSFNKEQEEWLRKLVSLKELHFTDCANLTTLPMNLVHFTTLQSLYIEKCPELKSFPEMGLPVSLKQLSVIRCHNNLSELCSHINICEIIIVSQDMKKESNLRSAKKRKLSSL